MKLSILEELCEWINTLHPNNIHCHHFEDEAAEDAGLPYLLKNSYTNWLGVEPGQTPEEHAVYLGKVQHNSYFYWLSRGLQSVYNMSEPLSYENWEIYDEMIMAAYRNPRHHIHVLKEVCGYDRTLLDAYWDPGSDNGHPEVFDPVFRVNMFFYGYSEDVSDFNGNNAILFCGRKAGTIDEYTGMMREIIALKKAQGAKALKVAMAYDRDNCFVKTSKKEAERTLKKGKDSTQEERIRFGNYVFWEICDIAAEYNMVLQCHTGLGKLDHSSAIGFYDAIREHPDTKFALLHCSYPWMDDMFGLVHNFKNVYPDLVWLPIISTSACIRALHELLDITTADKICWGCDSWTAEQSLGALMAAKHVVAGVLCDRIEKGFTNMEEAKKLAENIFTNNAKTLYGL